MNFPLMGVSLRQVIPYRGERTSGRRWSHDKRRFGATVNPGENQCN
jgi:hypothetical protein